MLVLYDVTSAYLEGECNELGRYGYCRDKKKGKKQLVVGLLTSADGEPLSIKVFEGNTSDPETVSSQIEVLKRRFSVEEVVFVGDRGMVKSKGKDALRENGFRFHKRPYQSSGEETPQRRGDPARPFRQNSLRGSTQKSSASAATQRESALEGTNAQGRQTSPA